MSALGAPRAKLITSAAIGGDDSNGRGPPRGLTREAIPHLRVIGRTVAPARATALAVPTEPGIGSAEVATEATDAELVARCRDGEQDAWAELVDRFSGYVYAILARGFRMADSQAEDVFQEVFARLYERLDSIRDDAAVRSWIG